MKLTLKTISAFVSTVLFFSGLFPAQLFAAALPVQYEVHHIKDLTPRSLKVYGGKNLINFVADSTGTNFLSLYFLATKDENGNSDYAVYKNDTLIAEGKTFSREPFIFTFTPDGHALYSIDGSTLYLDDKLLASGDVDISPSNYIHHDGVLTFPQGSSLINYDAKTNHSSTVYTAPAPIDQVRVRGTDYYYSTRESTLVGNTWVSKYHLYHNGEKFDQPIDSFELSPGGDLFYSVPDGSTSKAYKNDVFVKTLSPGGPGCLSNNSDAVFSYALYDGPPKYTSHIFVNGKEVSKQPLSLSTVMCPVVSGTHVGSIALSKFDAKHMRFYKDGKFVGDVFEMGDYKNSNAGAFDENRVTVGVGGVFYFRAFKNGHWALFRDGRKVNIKPLFKGVKDVMFFDIHSEGTVHLYVK